MGFLKFLQPKEKKMEAPKRLEIPPAPPTEEELPEFPSLKEKPEVRTAKQRISTVERVERESVKKEEEELKRFERGPEVKPVFVRVGAFKDVTDEIMLITNILKESEDTIIRVAEFKEDEDKEFRKWENSLKDIQQKLIFADQSLFGK
jgi:hypothetical protein